MKINNNISAVIANKHLLRNETALSKSMERLSSGYSLNYSWDNPSGMAISNKMRAQIRGLDRASQNSHDGVSLLNTADGAISEVTSILQRMRELSVQAANDTNTDTDKAAIQDEITSLKSEVDRISSTTEFNSKNLLDGTLDRKAYADDVTRLQVSDSVDAGKYQIQVTQEAQRATVSGRYPNENEDVPNGSFKVNGRSVNLNSGMTRDEAVQALRSAAEYGNVSVDVAGTNLTLTSGIKNDNYEQTLGNAFGESANINIDADFNDQGAKAAVRYFGLEITDPNTQEVIGAKEGQGKNAEVTLITEKDGGKFSETATASIDGRKVTITDKNDFSISFLMDKNATDDASTKLPEKSFKDNNGNTINNVYEIDVTDIGPMDLQVGANTKQQLRARIDPIDTESLYIDDLDVTKDGGAAIAMSRLDDAISTVNANRARIGAVTNRLDSTIDNLDNASENMNSAVSTLRDTDMASEMVEFTKDNVLQQAGTSALSQANELPQLALQLLQ